VDYNSSDEDAALISSDEESADDSGGDESFTPAVGQPAAGANARTSTGVAAASNNRRAYRAYRSNRRVRRDRKRLEDHHPELKTMWTDLEKMPVLKAGKAEQPKSISRQLKPFQLEGLAWMTAMEKNGVEGWPAW
jgi:DNA repair protein RAD16